jgi:phosphoribosylformylglycinamidine synthase II/phosphoribosylformylglycinamidine synthase I
MQEFETTEHPQTAVFRITIISTNRTSDDTAVSAAHQLGITSLHACYPARLYFIQGDITHDDAQTIARQLLTDPVTEEYSIVDVGSTGETTHSQFIIETTLLPGVTDPPAENLIRAAHLLGITGLARAATGQQFALVALSDEDGRAKTKDGAAILGPRSSVLRPVTQGQLDTGTLHRLATQILANPVIQRYTINQPISPPFFAYETADDSVEIIPILGLDDDALLVLSQARRLSLNLAEMQAIQRYYGQERRDPTDVELEMLAQTWSEHCVHKTFKATIDYTGPDGEQQTIDGILKTYIRAATEKIDKPWVRSAFVDNAGIVAFDDRFDLAFKVETHNHPSALEPFGGANTGIGGVVRDVLGVSARPIANTDILCFGEPEMDQADLPAGVLHPRRIAEGVVHGIEDYGNKMGIPTVNGSIHYHPGYTANPLVYCGCLGILPHGSHPTTPQPGDLIVAIGGRTGRDGLRGATFSSMEMDVETSEIAGTAVQIGHPIMEKQVQEVVVQARDARLYSAITDCGAGGFSSAVGEMAEGLGANVQLENVTLKYPGLRPWEIWLSEAQERMVLAIPPENWEQLKAICAGQDVEAIRLGEFEATGRLRLYYGEKLVGDLSLDFLHDGIPTGHMKAVFSGQLIVDSEQLTVDSEQPAINYQLSTINSESSTINCTEMLLRLLAHPDIRSKEEVIRRYDHEVQGGTAVKPLVGHANHGPSDAAVIVPQNSQSPTPNPQSPTRAVALGNGINPHLSVADPYVMAWAAVDEALRNVVAVGADPDQVSILDNFCWGNPNLPDRLGALVRCAQGCYDAAVAYQTPFISGKDSLNNEYTGADGEKHAIPGTLLVSAMGIVPDVAKTVTMDLKQAGNFLFALGQTGAELAGSHYELVGGTVQAQHQRPLKPVKNALDHFRALHRAIQAGLVRASHDCSEGGLGVALAEMCLAGGVGANIKLIYAPRDPYWNYSPDEVILFAQSLSRFIVEVRPEDAEQFRAIMSEANVPHECFGVIGGDRLVINGRTDASIIDLPLSDLEKAWRGGVAQKQSGGVAEWRSGGVPSHSPAPKILILHANGTNRDHDAALACQLAGGQPEIVHLNQLLAGERRLADYGMVVIPGGFSYGDDLGAGQLWAQDLRHRLGDRLSEFVANGRLLLGICNGFQVLVKAGLLQLPGHAERQVTLTYNENGRFECRWVYLQPNSHSPSLFTQGLDDPIYCPVAHGEGRLMVKDEATLARLRDEGLVALSYAVSSQKSEVESVGYPANPNGSVADIAGLCNAAGNVLGLMPHPENHIFDWQHPRVHRGERGLLGLRLFQNALRHL